jgi:hypothetical protein
MVDSGTESGRGEKALSTATGSAPHIPCTCSACAVAAERERCARVAENYSNIENRGIPTHVGIAAAIRERGMTDTKSARCPYCCCLLDGIAAHIDGCKCRPLPYERGEKA